MTRLDTDLARGFEAPPIKTGGQARAEQLKIAGAENDLVLDRQTIAANEQKLRQNEATANEAQRKQQGVAKLSELLATHSTVDEQGKRKVDHPAILKGLAASGFGDTALAYDTTRRADELSEVNNHIKELELADKKHDSLAKILNGVMKTGTEDGYHRGIGSALAEGLIKPDQAQQLFQQGWNDETKAQLAQLIDQSKTLKEDSDLYTARLDQKKKALMLPFDLKKAELDNTKLTQETTGTKPIQPVEQAHLDDADATRAQTASEGKLNRDVQMRGQNMSDARGRDLANATRDNKPPTTAQSKNRGFFDRAAQAEEVLSGLQDKMASKGFAGQLVQEYAPNAAQSDDNQSYDQAQRQFLTAYLRRDSGAVISPSEIASGKKELFPQPGDGKKVLEQKARARNNFLRSVHRESGKAAEDIEAPAPILSGAEKELATKSGKGGPKIGDVVNVGGKRVKIKALHGDGSFDGDEVK